MRKNKLGFTLIEMLAAVLIVAILTAVALPQYRRSIRRAEAVEALVNVRTLFDSAKRYKVSTSQVPMRLQGLDVTFFDASTDTASTFNLGKFAYTFTATGIKACRLNDGGFCFVFYYQHPTEGKDALLCEVQGSSAAGDWLCDSLSTRKNGSLYIIE